MQQFISLLEAQNELQRVTTPTELRYAIGTITRLEQHKNRQGGKALLFEDISGFPGKSVFTNGLGTLPRIALACGLDKRIPARSLIAQMRERFSNPIMPVTIKEAPGPSTFIPLKDIDLFKLPVPTWSTEETSPYIGTWHLNITKDPDTGVRNVGVYRMMLLDKSSTTLSVYPSSHLNAHLSKAEARGERLPMAVAIGVAEPLLMAAAASFPEGADELAYAGGLLQKPVELLTCQSISCEAPADCEIVLEGEIVPGRRVSDGPFFDYAGVANTNPYARKFEVTGMRLSPGNIFRGAAIGLAGAEDHVLYSVLAGLGLMNFHGKPLKNALQSALFRRKWYTLLQWSGRMGMIKNFIKGH